MTRPAPGSHLRSPPSNHLNNKDRKRAHLVCNCAANCKLFNTAFVLSLGAAQNTCKKVKDKTPKLIAMLGTCISDPQIALFLFFKGSKRVDLGLFSFGQFSEMMEGVLPPFVGF